MSKKKLLITYDHELFLGHRSGSVQQCMTEPAEKLAEIMDRHSIKGVFFVDTTCLLRLRGMAETSALCRADLDEVLRQLKMLSRSGHYIFPHLHPHWTDAVYDPETNNWSLTDTSHYRIHKLDADERKRIFSESVRLLEDVITPSPGQSIDSFRAGGWSVQPFEDLEPLFREFGIRNDFSVQRGFYQFTDAQHFDFSICPEKDIYRFSHDVCSEDQDGPFIEFSINSIHIPAMNRILGNLYLKFYYRLTGDHTFSNGRGHVPTDDVTMTPASSAGINMSHPGNIQRIAIELMHPVNLSIYRKFLRDNDYMHFISHPKMINELNMKSFDRFLQFAASEFELETDFRNMTA